MHTTLPIGRGDGLRIDEVRFRADTGGWTAPVTGDRHRVELVRRGVFGLRLRRAETTVDPVTAVAYGPGDERSIAHRPGATDVWTSVTVEAGLLAELTGGEPRLPGRPVPVSGRIELAHRLLLRRARTGADDLELTERAVALVAGVLDGALPGRVHRGRPATALARRRVAETARELLVHDPVTLGLGDLARRIGVSPHHLSRVFHAETGQTLSRFRTRLRVARALDRLQGGERDLARLAAELGFADHAHLTRTLREQVGHPPSAVRRLLAGTGGPGTA